MGFPSRAWESEEKKATSYFNPDLHRASRLKAAETDQSVSDLVNRPVKLSLAEDAVLIRPFSSGPEFWLGNPQNAAA